MPRQRSVNGCYRRQQIRQSKLPNVTAVQRKIRNSFRSSVHVGVEVTVDTFLPLLPSHRCHKDWIALHLRIIHCREANEYAGLGWWYFYFVRMPSEVRSRSPSSPSLPPSNSGALVLPGVIPAVAQTTVSAAHENPLMATRKTKLLPPCFNLALSNFCFTRRFWNLWHTEGTSLQCWCYYSTDIYIFQ